MLTTSPRAPPSPAGLFVAVSLAMQALVVHPRVGRSYGVSKPRVIGAERLLDLLELAPLMLRERHGALQWNSGRRSSLTGIAYVTANMRLPPRPGALSQCC